MNNNSAQYPYPDGPLNSSSPTREPLVSRQIYVLSENISLLEKEILELEKRLSPVLNKRLDDSSNEMEEKDPPMPELAKAILVNSDRISVLSKIIQGIFRSLEI